VRVFFTALGIVLTVAGLTGLVVSLVGPPSLIEPTPSAAGVMLTPTPARLVVGTSVAQAAPTPPPTGAPPPTPLLTSTEPLEHTPVAERAVVANPVQLTPLPERTVVLTPAQPTPLPEPTAILSAVQPTSLPEPTAMLSAVQPSSLPEPTAMLSAVQPTPLPRPPDALAPAQPTPLPEPAPVDLLTPAGPTDIAVPPPEAVTTGSSPVRPITWLAIPRIRLQTDVVPAQLIQDGDSVFWDIPKFVAGHAETTAGAGQPGNAVILGHLVSRTLGNVFETLDRTRPGDEVQVRSGEDEFDYTVVDVRNVDRTEVDVLDPTTTPTITLITCAGIWNPVLHDYMERLVVRGQLASDRE